MKNAIPGCKNCTMRSSTLFKECSNTELDAISANKEFREFKKGQVIFQEGWMSLGTYCIYSGKAKIVKYNREGREQIVKIVNKGDNFGYEFTLSDLPCAHTAIAMEDMQICFIPKKTFKELVTEGSVVNAELIFRLSSDINQAQETIKRMAFKPVRERMADALLLLNRIYTDAEENSKISISRTDLANFIGVAKETSSRILSELRSEEIIHIDGKNISIKDMNKLDKISSFYD